MATSNNETLFRNAVKRSGVNLANKTDSGFFPRSYVYMTSDFLDADLKPISFYDVKYKKAAPVWFGFHVAGFEARDAQRLSAAGFECKFVEVPAERGTRVTKVFYKAPAKAGK